MFVLVFGEITDAVAVVSVHITITSHNHGDTQRDPTPNYFVIPIEYLMEVLEGVMFFFC